MFLYSNIGIRALRLLDSLQIPIDYIAGASMGGIAGALYAIGYDAEELEQLASRSDWPEIFSDTPARNLLPFFEKKDTGKYQLEFGLKGLVPIPPSGLIRGQKISLLFSKITFAYEHISDFDELPIPYRCVAVDLITGNEVILKGGSLAKAMRATMAIPSVFSPVEWGDSLLIDGGLLNNFPVDVVRDMGADIVIGVNVGRPLKKRAELRSMLDILEQSISIPQYFQEDENIKQVDVLITPQLDGYSAADFENEKIEQIIRLGKIAAYEKLSELVRLKEDYGSGQIEDSLITDQVSPRVHGVIIAGNTTLPFAFIFESIGIKPGDAFVPDTLKARLKRLRHSKYIETIDYEIRPIGNDVRLLIHVKERRKPIIHGISIIGNKVLPFSFIYRLLGINPRDKFDTDILDQRITELYSLGYFETIHYEIEPVSADRIRLAVHVKERPQNKLRVGLRYDDRHNLVAIIGFRGTNILFPGLRLESDLQFAGLTRFQTKLFYPSRTQDLSIYPFFHVDYQDIPINIFGGEGKKIASYHDRSSTWGLGLGFLPLKFYNTEVEYSREYMNVAPIIAYSDSLFPSWNDELRKLQLSTQFDYLDNILLPSEGVLIKADYEGSDTRLGSDIDYTLLEFSADWYHTINQIHTVRFNIQYGYSEEDLPVYKWFYRGGPNSFVGVEYDEFAYYRSSIFRFDYRYKYKPNMYLKLIVNSAPNYNGDFYPIKKDIIWGYGLGIQYVSLFGPLELIFSRGDRIREDPGGAKRNVIYFTAGYRF